MTVHLNVNVVFNGKRILQFNVCNLNDTAFTCKRI